MLKILYLLNCCENAQNGSGKIRNNIQSNKSKKRDKKVLPKVKVSDKIAKSSNDRKQQKKRGKTTDCSKTQGSRRG